MKAEQQKTIRSLSQRLCAAVLTFCVLVPLPAYCNCAECPKNLVKATASGGCSCSHQEKKNTEDAASAITLQHNHSHQSDSVPCDCACVKPAVPYIITNTQTADLQYFLQCFAVITPVCFAPPDVDAGTFCPNNSFSPHTPDTAILLQRLVI